MAKSKLTMLQRRLRRAGSGVGKNLRFRRNRTILFLLDRFRFARYVYYRYRGFADAVAVENITECNRRCPYCPHLWKPRRSHRMPESLFSKIIDDLRDLDFRGQIVLSPWGEALLDERLASFLRHAKNKLPRSEIEIQTNGDLLTLDTLRKLVAAGADAFHVSEHFSLSDGHYVYDEPAAALETFRALAPNERKFMHFDSRNRNRISRQERFHNRSGLVPLRDSLTVEKLCRVCSFPESFLAINSRGDVLLCARQWIDRPSFGQVQNEHLGDIWKKAEFRRVRTGLLKGRSWPVICRDCRLGFLPEAAELQGWTS